MEILQEASKILQITEQKVKLLEEGNKILREKLRETDTSINSSLPNDRMLSLRFEDFFVLSGAHNS